MAKDNTRIPHEGVIAAITESSIQVEILSKSACAACHAKGACPASDQETRMIDVPLTIGTLTSHYQVGDKVNVILTQSLGTRAVFLAYGIPLLLLLISMIVASACGLEELYVGLTGIGMVIIYYIVLAFFKNRLSRVFTFSIEKIQ